VSLKNLLRT